MTRPSGWLPAPIEQALRCQHGHRINDGVLVTDSQCVRCKYKTDRDVSECGALLWVVRTRLGAVYVASVTIDDVRQIHQHADVFETLRYLGATMWGEAA